MLQTTHETKPARANPGSSRWQRHRTLPVRCEIFEYIFVKHTTLMMQRPTSCPGAPGDPGEAATSGKEVVMAKHRSRPSLQYRYEHYDPRW